MADTRYLSAETIFNLAKAFIYLSLCISGSQFILEDFTAAGQLLNAQSTFSDYLNVFTITIDVLAWIILLIIFELETNIVSDETLNRGWKYIFNILSALCYVVIVSAFVGYWGKLEFVTTTLPYTLGNPCDLVGGSTLLMSGMDEYTAITLENCAALDPSNLGQLALQPLIYEKDSLADIAGLAWADFINSGTWLLVVVFLQADIILQLKGLLTRRLMFISGGCKIVLYALLFVVAGYWGVKGTFIDFWDAAMWLAGFMLIDLNILSWNKETEAEKKASHVDAILST
jgi:hypothetical protein